MGVQQHWEQVYQTKPDEKLSWLQSEPKMSLALAGRLDPAPRRVLDAGGGQSALAAALLQRGTEQVTVIDIAPAAIERARQRAGDAVLAVQWLVGDVTRCDDLPQVDLWHDRAVFHFLTDEDDRRRYRERALAVVRPGGWLIVATFGPDGPEMCSGLPVRRYDAAGLAEEFGDGFTLVESADEQHQTPWGKVQAFTYAVLQRRG